MEWTLGALLQWMMQKFQEKGFESPRLDAQVLLSHVTGRTRTQLYTDGHVVASDAERHSLRELVQRRLKGEPVAYLLGEKHWHDLVLKVDKRVLIPRPETETLLDLVLGFWPRKGGGNPTPKRIVDLCTGSGCLAIALARRFPDAKVIAVDVSSDALDVAKENAKQCKVPQIEWWETDVTNHSFVPFLREKLDGDIDILVSNPPYVTENEWEKMLDSGVRDYEPKLALVSPDEGFAVGRTIWRACRPMMSAESVLALELAAGHPHRAQVEVGHVPLALPHSTPLGTWPRGRGLGVRDLEGKARFLFEVRGLQTGGSAHSEAVAGEDVGDAPPSDEALAEGAHPEMGAGRHSLKGFRD